MADREVIGVELIAKLDEFRKEFKSIPKTTDAETKAALGLALKNLNKLQREAGKAGKETKAALKPASDGVKEFADTAGDTDSALKALAGAVGLVSPAAAAALSGMGDLAGGAEGAAKASKLLGGGLQGLLIAGGVALAVAGVGYAAYAAVSGVVSLVDGAGDLARSLNDVEKKGGATSTIGVPEATIKSFNEASASLDAIGLLVDQFKVSVADELTPAVQGSAKAILVMGLVARDVFQSYSQGEGIFRSLARFSVEVLVGALMGPVEALANMARGMGELAKIAGLESVGDTLIGVSKGWFDLKTTIADTVIDAVVWTTADAVDGLSVAFSGYIEEADALISTTEEYNRKTRDAGEIAQNQAEAERRKAKALADAKAVQEALTKAIGATSSASLALRKEEEETIAKMVEHSATEEQIDQAREAYAARRVKLTQETVSEVLALEQGASKSLMAIVDGYVTKQLTAQEKLETELAGVRAQIIEGEKTAQAELAKIAEEALVGGDFEALREVENQRIELAQQTQEALTAIAEEGAERRKALSKDELTAGIQDTLKISGDAIDAWSTLMSDRYQKTQDALTKAKERGDTDQVESLEKRAKRERGLLTAMFRADQAVKISQVVMDTAAGISSVWARWAHRPVFAGILSGLVTATGIAQGATIAGASPQYHTGGIVRPEGVGIGDVPARLIPGEVVMSPQAVKRMGGAAQADRLNRNSSMGMGGSVILEQKYGHRVFDEVVYDDVRRPDSSLRKAVSGRARRGHRAR